MPKEIKAHLNWIYSYYANANDNNYRDMLLAIGRQARAALRDCDQLEN